MTTETDQAELADAAAEDAAAERKRNRATIDASHLEAALVNHRLTAVQLSQIMGMSDGYVGALIKDGKAPPWTRLVTELLDLRAEANAVTYQVRVPRDRLEDFDAFMRPMVQMLGVTLTEMGEG